jgi:hypothetical protein
MIEKGTAKERIEERKRSNSITSARRPIQEMERSSIAGCGMLERGGERAPWWPPATWFREAEEGGLPGGRQQNA